MVVAQQVRRHGGDRQPPPGGLAGVRRRPGSSDVGRHFVVVTDPGSPLDATGARMAGFRAVILADPDVGGRYSALTAFGLVPAALAGVDVAELLDQAEALRRQLGRRPSTTRRSTLGAALGAAATAGRDKIVARRRRLRHRRPRRLGRAADRRVDRQGRPGPAAGRGRGPDRARRRRRRTSLTGHRRRRARRATPARRRSHVASTARSARSSWPGSTRPRSPAGCSGSTRSTSPTCRSRRTTPPGSSTSGPPAERPRVHRRRDRGVRRRRRCSARPTTVAGALRRAARAAIPDAATWRSWPTWTGSATPTAADLRGALARRHRPGGHLRLGAAVPALDRAVPQGRPAGRRVPADHRRGRRTTSDGAGPAVRLRPRCRRRRRPATGRRWPAAAARCCTCT